MTDHPQKICVRLPNWLGDVVMSFGFLQNLKEAYPNAEITVVVKKGLEPLVSLFPGIHAVLSFSKQEYKGLRGVWQFGRKLKREQGFDLFFVLPDSFSSAVMAFASGAGERIGYGKETRHFLLTRSYTKPKHLHRVEEYASLISLFLPQLNMGKPQVKLPSAGANKKKYIVVNINSEAVSRRLPVEKAVALLLLLQSYSLPVKLIGSAKEKNYVTDVLSHIKDKSGIENLAGETNLPELVQVIEHATCMISSDSGPAHIGSACNVPLIVIFGAGDERNTGPYNNSKAFVVRNGSLPCEPCRSNTCQIAKLPVCLTQFPLQKIVTAINKILPEHE